MNRWLRLVIGSAIFRRAAVGAAVLGGAIATPVSTAQAAEPNSPLSISWTGPSECGSDLEESTRSLLGSWADKAGVHVQARAVQLPNSTYRIDLNLEGEISGSRSLESARCDEAIQAAAVVLALAINPDALLSSPPQPDPQEPERRSEPGSESGLEPSDNQSALAPDTKSQTPPARTAADPWRPYAQMSARLSGGLVPGMAWGASLALGLEHEWIRLGLHGFISPDTEQSIAPQGAASFVAFGAGLDGCARFFEFKTLAARLCPGLSVVSIKASPTGLEGEITQRALLYVPRALGEVGVQLHARLALFGAGGIQIPTTQVDFQVDSDTTPTSVHRVSPGPLFRLGAEFLF